VLSGPCPTARVQARLPLALIEQIDQTRGHVSRSAYLATVVDAAMSRSHPHLPEGATTSGEWSDRLAERRHQQHVRSIELATRKEASS